MDLFGRSFSCRRRSILRSESHLSQSLQHFMASPLVTWVKTFGSPLDASGGGNAQYMEVKTPSRRDCQAEYLKLADGVFLNKIMRQIDPYPQNQRIYRNESNEEVLRVQNLTILIQHIKTFYQEDLQQLILMSLPNVQLLGRDPLSDEGLQEMRTVLLLLLGCAVQCERKEEFIEQIQELDLDTQACVASHIQEITQNQQNMVALHWPDVSAVSLDDLELLFQNMADHLKDLVSQRDENMERIAELTQERQGHQSSPSVHGPGENRQHLTVQLADSKAKLRRLRQELEEKSEELQDCKQELQQMETDLKWLKKENRELALEMRTARTYRDELDILREKAARVDRLQSEVRAYKKRLNNIEFYKGKVEEEREYSQALLETKTVLEEQLESARVRCDKLHELEKENLLLRSRLQDLEMEQEADRQKVEELLEENLSLESELKQSLGESMQLSWKMEPLSEEPPPFELIQKPLSYEVDEVMSNQLLKLERENQDLRRREEQLRLASDDASANSSAKILTLERENQQLQRALDRLRAQIDDEKQNIQSVKGLSTDLMREKEQLEQTMRTLRENSDREVQELKLENEHLSQAIASLRQRSQVSTEARAKDIEKENKILHEAIMETSLKQSKLEFERKQSLQALEQCKARADAAEELEQELGRVEKLNEQLQKKILDLRMSCERVALLEDRASGMEAENGKLKKALESFMGLPVQLEALEKDNAHLDQENLQLRRMVEMQKMDNAMMSQLELENKELQKERDQLRRTLDLQKASVKRAEDLESTHQSLQLETQRLSKSLDNARKKVLELEQETEDLEREVQTQQRNLEEQRMAVARLEQDKEALEQELGQGEKDRRQREKENRRLRQQAEIRDASLDEHNFKVARLEQENRQLVLELGRTRESWNNLRELELENEELLQQLTTDKKELASLREELRNEKLKVQQLGHEPERIGLNREQVLPGEPSAQESDYKLLELKLESVFKETLEIREAHITSLRCQLEEAGRRNQVLSNQLKEPKENSEQMEPKEEVTDKMAAGRREAEIPADVKLERQESIRDVISDRLIEVERNNATLLAEKGALSSHFRQLETQNNNLQAQILTLQKHTVSLQEQNTSLQALNTKLQVENSSLGSQNASLSAQSSQLQSTQASLEAESKSLVKGNEELQRRFDSLLRDHEKLALLHECQEAEFEGLIEKHGGLKGRYKTLESEHKELEERYNQLLAQTVQMEELEAGLKIKQEALEKEGRKQQGLGEAHQKLQDDYDRLCQSHADCGKQQEELRTEHKAVKSQLNVMQLEKTRSEAECSILKEQSQQLDIRWTKLSSQCELLNQLKGNLEEENRHLLHQIKALTDDNRALLEKTVESKDLFHQEQQQSMDKLNELRREKQKLLEKIMDQYRVIDPAMPRRKGNWIADKMKKLIKPRKELSKDQLRTVFINPTGGPDNSEGIVHLSQLENSKPLEASSKPTSDSDTLSRQAKVSGPDSPPEPEKILVRARRKLSSRIYASETPRQRFRQRRVGWYMNENEDEETDSSPSRSSNVSRDSDPTLDYKELAKHLEPNKESQSKNPEASDSTEGLGFSEPTE